MKKPGYYSSGEFARMAHVTLRTIRYYDKQNILKPSYVTEAGARFYTDEDFARLQQILLLKYLGFSLDDIRDMTIDDADYHFMLNSLNIQLKLVRDRIEQMQLVEKAIQDGADMVFTTSPKLVGASLRAALRHPNVRILNCSVDMPYASIRTYYSRVYEAKFITGTIAAAVAREDRVNHVLTFKTSP